MTASWLSASVIAILPIKWRFEERRKLIVVA